MGRAPPSTPATSFLALLRLHDDASSHVAAFLELEDLHNAALSTRAAVASALRRRAFRLVRLELPPDSAKVRSLLQAMDADVAPLVERLGVADFRDTDAIGARLGVHVRSLRVSWPRYHLLPTEPNLGLGRLRGFTRLTELDLSFNEALDDLTGLESLGSLRGLNLSHTSVHELTPLARLASLICLNLDTTPITSIAPVAGLKRLQTLDLSYTRALRDLSPLSSLCGLRSLVLNRKAILEIDSMSAIAHLLVHLELADSNVQSIPHDARVAFVRSLANVEYLDLSWSRFITQLEPLNGLRRLRVLKLCGEKFPDLEALIHVPQLEELAIKQDIDVDLSPLAALVSLKRLHIFGFRPYTGPVGFLASLPALEILNVSSLFRLGMPQLSRLRQLGVTVLSYSEYFKYPRAPALTHLSICSRVDLNQVLPQFPCLRHLCLEEVDRVALHSLAQFTNLETLEIGRKGTPSQPIPSDHSFLRPLKKLRTLRIQSTSLPDLFSISGLTELVELCLDGTQVRDCGLLSNMCNLEVLSLADTKIRHIPTIGHMVKLRRVYLPKAANCGPLQRAFHHGEGLLHLKEVLHPTHNCLWGQHRHSALV